MSYSLIDLSENAQDNRYPITNDFGLLYDAVMRRYHKFAQSHRCSSA